MTNTTKTTTTTTPAAQSKTTTLDTRKAPALREQEFLATLRTLIAVAKADGKIEAGEKDALMSVLTDVKLPDGVTLDALLQEKIDLDAQLALVTTPGAGEQLFHSALAVARAGHRTDGQVPAETRAVLDRIQKRFGVSPDREKFLDRMWNETKDTLLLSNIQPMTDPVQRAAAVEKDVLKYSVMSAVLGSFPVPGLAIATDMGVVALQVKLVHDIGQYWGHKLDRSAATSLLGGLGLGTGLRIAVSNVAKLVPGWGSVVGATGSFASTWALGKVATKYFESGMKADFATLKTEFRTAEKAGREAYSRQAPAIEAKRKETSERIGALQADLESGKLSRAEYEAKLVSLS